jgi:hypothetical protein
VQAWAQGLLSTLGCLLSTTNSETACRIVSFLASFSFRTEAHGFSLTNKLLLNKNKASDLTPI